MKNKAIRSIGILLMPVIIWTVSNSINFITQLEGWIMFLIVPMIANLLLILWLYKKKTDNLYLIPLSFLFSIFIMFGLNHLGLFCDSNDPEGGALYAFTIIYYFVPFGVISLISAIISTIKNKRK